MKMVIVLTVCLALSAASASAMQMPCAGLQCLYGAGAGASALTTMMGAGGLYPFAEYLRQPQCSPLGAPAPYYAGCAQTMWQPSAICQPLLRQQCCQQMRMMDMQSVAQQLQMMMQLQGASLYEPALMQQQLLAAQGLNPMAMMMAQNMPAMGGLYRQLPSYGTTPCGVSTAIPPYYY